MVFEVSTDMLMLLCLFNAIVIFDIRGFSYQCVYLKQIVGMVKQFQVSALLFILGKLASLDDLFDA